MKKIAYFGGLYSAEFSLRQSLVDQGIDVVFPVTSWYRGYSKTTPFKDIKLEDYGVHIIGENDAQNFLRRYKPDIVIHRFYRDDPLMHRECGVACRKLKIPYIVYRMETWPLEPVKPVECDLFLYAHKCDEPYINLKVPTYFYPYGVSSVEKSIVLPKKYDIASFGYGRMSLKTRYDNFLMYYNAACAADKTIDVFWDSADINKYKDKVGMVKVTESVILGTDERGHPRKTLIPAMATNPIFLSNIRFNEQFPMTNQTIKINESKVIVNVDTATDVPFGFSHKMWQSLGCGVPTLTIWKEGVEEAFGPNMENCIYVHDTEEAAQALMRLFKDKELYTNISKRSEKYMHDKYDWCNRLHNILTKEGLWV